MVYSLDLKRLQKLNGKSLPKAVAYRHIKLLECLVGGAYDVIMADFR